MSGNDRKRNESGACSTACRCLFGYFPWVPLVSCTTTIVMIAFWKLSVDSSAMKTKTLMSSTGLKNETATSLLDNCSLATSVLCIVTIVVFCIALVLSVFRGHQRALQDGVYGAGAMPASYYWLHMCFGLILSGLLLLLVLAFVAALVGVSFWYAGAAAGESAATTASRVFLHNAQYAGVMDGNNNALANNYTNVRGNLDANSQVAMDTLFNDYMTSVKQLGFPMQGTCKLGCIDLKELSDLVDQPVCKCSSWELTKLAKQANLLQSELRMALGSISLAIVFGLIMLMNTSSRITDTRRDLGDDREPLAQQHFAPAVPKAVELTYDMESGIKQHQATSYMTAHMSLDTAPTSTTISSQKSSGIDLANAWRQRIAPAPEPNPSDIHAAPTPVPSNNSPTTAQHASNHSANPSYDSALLNSLTFLTSGGKPSHSHSQSVTSLPPAPAASTENWLPRTVPPPIVPPTPTYSQGAPSPSPTAPLVGGGMGSTVTAASTPNTNINSSVVGGLDLKDGWKAISARYGGPAPAPKEA